MDRREKAEQIRTMEELTGIFDVEHRFTASDIRKIHGTWLGGIYEWAGKYWQVTVSKNGFPFAFPAQNYKPMEKVFAAVIRKTLRVRGQQ